MESFQELKLTNALRNALQDLGFERPTPIQAQSYSVVRSGKNVVGIAQTGTGKSFAYLLPLLQDLKFSKQSNPRILVIVPTRELVNQVVAQTESLCTYMDVRVQGVYGGVSMNTQKNNLLAGMDILVATPGRLYDLVLSKAVQLKSVKKLVIDEVDEMLELGFRYQLTNLFDLLPERRQNIMFSATLSDDIDTLIDQFFFQPERIFIAISGTPLANIKQVAIACRNFHTKANLLSHLLADKDKFSKVLVFLPNKKLADLMFELMSEKYEGEMGLIHSNKSQNYRNRSVEAFNSGEHRVLIATDILSRGLDLDQISQVINVDCPSHPENYIHRIGRTGRAEKEGESILLYTEKEIPAKEAIEALMQMKILDLDFPEEVEVSTKRIPSERPAPVVDSSNPHRNHKNAPERGPSFHEKKLKNQKVNLGGKYKREIEKKYKKPKTRGDKIQNRKKKR